MACVVMALAFAHGQEARRKITTDVPFVPTLPEIVEEMLKLANVGRDDVIYDLGCGDGRLFITAVKKFGAKRGVGVDIDPQRIKDSNENARAAGVLDRVSFSSKTFSRLTSRKRRSSRSTSFPPSI